MRHLILTAATALFFLSSNGQTYHRSIQMQVIYQPALIPQNGRQIAYYEIQLMNFSKDTFLLKNLQVINISDSSIHHSYRDSVLADKLYTVQRMADKNTILPGAIGVLYLEIDTNEDKLDITHRLQLAPYKNPTATFEVIGAALNLKASSLILGTPLKGTWAAIYNPAWATGHRRTVFTVDGKARIPGRYAIDFIKVNAEGNHAIGEENEIKNWLGYGSDVYAVADGEVCTVVNSFAESATISGHKNTTIPTEKGAGCFLSVKIGDSIYSFYEHLKPGSIVVSPGQKIKKGDRIAALGYTGHSMGPHLHFHIANNNSSLGAEGIPFTFEEFTNIGHYDDISTLGKKKWIADEPKKLNNQRPLPNSVIVF